jgi:predicted nucleic acid-binding protein
VFVDSSAWIALLSARDQNHVEADVLFREAGRRRIALLTTNLVLAEVHRLLLFRAGRAPAAAALARLDESRMLKLIFASHAHHRVARGWLDKLDDQHITYTDAVSFAVMGSEHCRTAFSFDHDFWIAGFEPWQR